MNFYRERNHVISYCNNDNLLDINKGRQGNLSPEYCKIQVSSHLSAMSFTSEKVKNKREHGPGNHQGKAGLISIQSVKSDSSNNFSAPF
jgi:hypothetical protein